jgi:hypothetical protein
MAYSIFGDAAPVGLLQKRPLEITTDKRLIIRHGPDGYNLRFQSVYAYHPKEGDIARMIGLFRTKPLKYNAWFVGKLFKLTDGKWTYDPTLKDPTIIEYYGFPLAWNYHGSWVLEDSRNCFKLAKHSKIVDVEAVPINTDQPNIKLLRYEYTYPSTFTYGANLTVYEGFPAEPEQAPFQYGRYQHFRTYSVVPGQTIRPIPDQRIDLNKPDNNPAPRHFRILHSWFYPDNL